MLNIAVVEDDSKYCQVLCEYIRKYEETLSENEKISITTYSDGIDIASEYTAKFDIIFLDIQMKLLDGMKTAQAIRKLDSNVLIIFVTSSVEYAVQGYTVDAIGYLIKPVKYLAFSQILQKAIKQLNRQAKEYIAITMDSGKLRLDISRIYYIESQRHDIFINTEDGQFITDGPLKRFEELLSSKGFSKCHNAYLVNLKHVEQVTNSDITISGKTLPLSRTKKKAFLDSLADYIGGITR